MFFCSEVVGQIGEAFETLADEVRRRKDTMLAELETNHADEQTILARRADSLENLLIDVTNCCEFTQNVIRHGNETEVRTALVIFAVFWYKCSLTGWRMKMERLVFIL